MGSVSLRVQQAFGLWAAGRQDDIAPNAHGVAGKFQSFVLWNQEPSLCWNALGDSSLSVVIEGGRKIKQLAPAQRAEAGIKMVEAAVD